MSSKNIVCILPSYQAFMMFGGPLAHMGIGIAHTLNDPITNAYIVDETNDKLIERYKIMLRSLNPINIPNERMYQGDLYSIMKKLTNPDSKDYEPHIGFYRTELVTTNADIKEGQLVLVQSSDAANVVYVKKVRQDNMSRRVFGQFRVDPVVGKAGSYNTRSLVGLCVEDKIKMQLTSSYHLKPIALEDVFETKVNPYPIRAGSPVPPHQLMTFA